MNKQDTFQIKGMMKDLGNSKGNPQFAYDIMNMRPFNFEETTLGNLSNDFGTSQMPVVDKASTPASIQGVPLGICKITEDAFVLFTVDKNGVSYIYRCLYNQGEISTPQNVKHVKLFQGNLGFDINHPIEALYNYENEKSQKVYWTDGLNPLKYINIAVPEEAWPLWTESSFEFTQELELRETITVNRRSGAGKFHSGVIQYAFTYYNLYGAESAVFYHTPLYYMSPDDRGGAADEIVSCNFKIDIANWDTKFEYMRVYAIARTSIDGVPAARKVTDILLPRTVGDPLIVIDNGAVGETVTATSVLYKGGEEIIAQTMDAKDNTLFLGNITLKKSSVHNIMVGSAPAVDLATYAKGLSAEFTYNAEKTQEALDLETFYPYDNQLKYNSEQIKNFKQGVVYRLGFQAQYKDGTWSSVVHIKDVLNELPIKDNSKFYSYGGVMFPTPEVRIPTIMQNALLANGYKRIRPVVAFSTFPQWKFQGIVNPTMYNVRNRAENNIYSQASWFNRPNAPYDYNTTAANPINLMVGALSMGKLGGNCLATGTNSTITDIETWGQYQVSRKLFFWGHEDPEAEAIFNLVDYENSRFFVNFGGTSENTAIRVHGLEPVTPEAVKAAKSWAQKGTNISSKHGYPTPPNIYKNCEIQCIPNYSHLPEKESYFGLGPVWKAVEDHGNNFLVDQSIFTIDAPEFLFKSKEVTSFQDYQFRIVGAIPITTNKGDYEIIPEGPLTPYTWETIDGLPVVDNGIIEGNLYDALDDADTSPAEEKIPNIDKEAVFRFPKGTVKVNFGCPTPSSHAFKTTCAIPVWQDGLIMKSKMVHGAGSWEASSACEAFSFANDTHTILNPNWSAYYMIYPWHSKKLNNEGTKLKTKILSNFKVSAKTVHFDFQQFHPIRTQEAILFDNDVDSVKIKDCHGNIVLYGGNIDQILTTDKVDRTEGFGYPITVLAGDNAPDGSYHWSCGKMPASSFSEQFSKKQIATVEQMQTWIVGVTGGLGYNNPDGAILNKNYLASGSGAVAEYRRSQHKNITSKDPVHMKYKSWDHLVITSKVYIDDANDKITVEILPTLEDTINEASYDEYGTPIEVEHKSVPINRVISEDDPGWNPTDHTPFWENEELIYFQNLLTGITQLQGPDTSSTSPQYGWSWLGELYSTTPPFLNATEETLSGEQWLPCASPIRLDGVEFDMYYMQGDTYYQRFDSLKTYPYTNEDANQVIDLISFMCETPMNIDGRYDKNRNTTFLTTISPTNFNLMNQVYSQTDNFFQQKYLLKNRSTIDEFENTVTWSMTKINGEDIDSWTNISLANVLDLDGARGPVNVLKKYNDQLMCFQDSGISVIMYNSNVQIASTSGVPIEIANSYKVDGKRYLSTTSGCRNKWSMVETPKGLYFIDDINKQLFMYQSQITNVSESKGFNSWFHSQCNFKTWSPKLFDNFVSYFDSYYKEVLFVNKDHCLAFSEILGNFTSFLSYEHNPFFINLNKDRFFIRPNAAETETEIHIGNIVQDPSGTNKYFGVEKNVWITLQVQGNPVNDKIFNGVEFRNEFYNSALEDDFISNDNMFDVLNVWTDFQRGAIEIEKQVGVPASLKQKFRINRIKMPRDTENAIVARRRDRIRNPWAFIQLWAGTNKQKFRVHDIVVNYTEG